MSWQQITPNSSCTWMERGGAATIEVASARMKKKKRGQHHHRRHHHRHRRGAVTVRPKTPHQDLFLRMPTPCDLQNNCLCPPFFGKNVPPKSSTVRSSWQNSHHGPCLISHAVLSQMRAPIGNIILIPY